MVPFFRILSSIPPSSSISSRLRGLPSYHPILVFLVATILICSHPHCCHSFAIRSSYPRRSCSSSNTFIMSSSSSSSSSSRKTVQETAAAAAGRTHSSSRLFTVDNRSESSLSIQLQDVQDLDIEQLSREMNERAKEAQPFTVQEMDEIMKSFENVMPADSGISLEQLRELIQAVGHLPHKDWERTGESAQKLQDILLESPPTSSRQSDNDDDDDDLNASSHGLSLEFQQIFKRVIEEGNWNAAAAYAATQNYKCDSNSRNNKGSNGTNKPWAVLVTGVNGIRKTTSVYQPWFQQLLHEALIPPSISSSSTATTSTTSTSTGGNVSSLPTGENSFFRQLDHMIITIINHNFQKLYAMTALSHDFENQHGHEKEEKSGQDPPSAVIQKYSNYKAAIFSRYRTLSEILGVLLVRQAKASKMNIMIETSGRDVAMFHYVDSFFPSEEYNKLALHFTINDLSHAESSVDSRMVKEMREGIQAMQSGDVHQVIKANAGGPYGSEVLKSIQRESDAVWDAILLSSEESSSSSKRRRTGGSDAADGGGDVVGRDWFKASIQIHARDDGDWTANAILPDGSKGTVFQFHPPRKV